MELGVIANIAVVSYHNIHPIRSTYMEEVADSKRLLHGRICTPIYDVIAALLDNAFVHSGLRPEEVNARVGIQVMGHRLRITVSNDLFGLNSEDVVNKINAKIETHSVSPSGDAVRLEGGTGLQKIIKILQLDLARSDWKVDAESLNSKTVKVIAEFNLKGLEA